jgi:hypothetical protein
MNVTVNQIRKEMTTLVQAHDMVNSFFWGDFHRAYNEKTQLYPLVCSYLSDGAVNTNMTQMQLVVIVCDKTFKGLENLNDTESDTVTVARHLYNVIRQSPRWNNLLRVNSATLSKFYENTSDEVAGVILTMNVDIKQSRSLCDLPLDNYDFEGTFIGGGGDCEDVLIVNSDQTFTFSAESGTIVELPDAPVLVTDQDGNPLGSGNVPSVTGGVVEVTIEPCPPCENATYVLTLGGNAVDSGEIGSGQTEEIPIDAFIPPCEDATVQINGDQVATVASGGMVNIAVENESGTPLGTFDEETGVWVVPDCEDATAVLRDTDNNILSTTPIASGATENITAPDGTVTVNRDGVFFADVDVTSGGVASVNVPSSTEWVRNPDWLPLPEITAADNRFVGLFLVFENGYNLNTVRANAGNIDWGDGTSVTANNTIQTKLYDYSTITSPVHQYYDGRNYKQVIVDITGALTNLELERNSGVNNGGQVNYVDAAFSFNASFVFSANQRQMTILERLLVFKCNNITALTGGRLTNLSSLRVLGLPFNQITQQTVFIRLGVPVFQNLDISNTNNSSLLFEGGFTEYFGDIDVSSSLDCTRMFRVMSRLKSTGAINMQACTNITTMFQSDPLLMKTKLINCGNIITTTNAFNLCPNLSELELVGMRVGFSVNGCSLSAVALNTLMISLDTANGAQNLDFRNNPGAATCDTTIATAKGYTVTII